MWQAITNQGRQHWLSKVAIMVTTTPAILVVYEWYDGRSSTSHPCVCDTPLEHHHDTKEAEGSKRSGLSSSTSSGSCQNDRDTPTLVAVNYRSRCDLAWVKDHGDSTHAECSVVHNSNPQHNGHSPKRHEDSLRSSVDFTNTGTHNINNNAKNTFDPVHSKFFEVKLTTPLSSRSGGKTDGDSSPVEATTENRQQYEDDDDSAAVIKKISPSSSSTPSDAARTPLLHNTIVVLPDLLTAEECELIVLDAERILHDQHKMNKGVKTEKWTMYTNFSPTCQKIMDTLLQDHILTFLECRLPHVAKHLFYGGRPTTETLLVAKSSGADTAEEYPLGSSVPRMDNNSSSSNSTDGFYHWDDPVVIKYISGNQLAPHEDMRELTIVVPLNPLGEKDDTAKFPLVGGGTRFWLEGTSPESATSDAGVSIKPSPGSGILFNGDITHSGNSVHQGTRFVLMTSICLDEDSDYDDVDNDGED